MNVDAVDDHVLHELDRNLGPIADANICTPTIDCLVVRQDELFAELDDHVTGKDYPEWFGLDHSVAQGSWLWVHHVIVRWISDHVELPALASSGLAAKTEGTVSQPLPVVGPTRLASPAPIDRIRGQARATG